MKLEKNNCSRLYNLGREVGELAIHNSRDRPPPCNESTREIINVTRDFSEAVPLSYHQL